MGRNSWRRRRRGVADGGGPISPRLLARGGTRRSPVIYHEWIKCASERNNDPPCGNTWENPATIVLTANAAMEKRRDAVAGAWSPRRDYNDSGFSRNVSGLRAAVFLAGRELSEIDCRQMTADTFSHFPSLLTRSPIYYKYTVTYPRLEKNIFITLPRNILLNNTFQNICYFIFYWHLKKIMIASIMLKKFAEVFLSPFSKICWFIFIGLFFKK